MVIFLTYVEIAEGSKRFDFVIWNLQWSQRHYHFMHGDMVTVYSLSLHYNLKQSTVSLQNPLQIVCILFFDWYWLRSSELHEFVDFSAVTFDYKWVLRKITFWYIYVFSYYLRKCKNVIFSNFVQLKIQKLSIERSFIRVFFFKWVLYWWSPCRLGLYLCWFMLIVPW